MIAIVGLMPEELAVFHAETAGLTRGKGKVFTYHRGTWDGRPVILLQCGVGKVNAAAAVQYLLHEYPVKSVILQGVAGGVHPTLRTGSIVVADRHIQHDMDATALGFQRGQIPFSTLREFRSDPMLLAAVCSSCDALGIPHIVGRIVSGDRFIADGSDVRRLRDEFSADAVDMEGAAVAQVCALHGVPFLSVKTISDGADDAAARDFAAFIARSSEQLFHILRHAVTSLPHPSLRARGGRGRRMAARRPGRAGRRV